MLEYIIFFFNFNQLTRANLLIVSFMSYDGYAVLATNHTHAHTHIHARPSIAFP